MGIHKKWIFDSCVSFLRWSNLSTLMFKWTSLLVLVKDYYRHSKNSLALGFNEFLVSLGGKIRKCLLTYVYSWKKTLCVLRNCFKDLSTQVYRVHQGNQLQHSGWKFNIYRKALRYTASSCTDLSGARFWMGSKKIWDEWIYEVKTLSSTIFWVLCLHSIK